MSTKEKIKEIKKEFKKSLWTFGFSPEGWVIIGDDGTTLKDQKGVALSKEEAVTVLGALLKDEEAKVRWSAIFALGETGLPGVVPVLIEALCEDRDWEGRWRAAQALGRVWEITRGEPEMEASEAVAVLTEAMRDDESEKVRERAAWALKCIAKKLGYENYQTLVQQFEEQRRKRTIDTAYPTILQLLPKLRPNIPIVLSIFAELCQLPKKQTEEVLKSLLKEHPDFGEYLELEQVFIRSDGTEEAINELLRSFERSEKKS